MINRGLITPKLDDEVFDGRASVLIRAAFETGGEALRATDFLSSDCCCCEGVLAATRGTRGSESVGDGVEAEDTGSECAAAGVRITETGDNAVIVLRAPSSESGASRDHSMRLAAALLVMRRVWDCDWAECTEAARVESALALVRAHLCTELSCCSVSV